MVLLLKLKSGMETGQMILASGIIELSPALITNPILT